MDAGCHATLVHFPAWPAVVDAGCHATLVHFPAWPAVVDAGCHATLVHFPAWPAVWLARNDDTGFQQVLERADYLAKEHTKAHCTGERNFGCSRG